MSPGLGLLVPIARAKTQHFATRKRDEQLTEDIFTGDGRHASRAANHASGNFLYTSQVVLYCY